MAVYKVYFRMVILILVLFYYSTTEVSSSPDSASGSHLAALRRFARSSKQEKCVADKGVSQCADNCKTLLFCNPADKETIIGQFNCPGDCDIVKKKCVDKRPDDQCSAPSAITGVCPSDEGYFPDPANCRQFNYCEGGKNTASYECPYGYVFNMETSNCNRSTPCGSINCFGKDFAVHSTYTYLYALCSNNNIVVGSYSKCSSESQQFDIKAFACVSKCVKEGNIAHESDCHKYYRCLATGAWGTLEKSLQSCPPGQGFDSTKGLCNSATVCP